MKHILLVAIMLLSLMTTSNACRDDNPNCPGRGPNPTPRPGPQPVADISAAVAAVPKQIETKLDPEQLGFYDLKVENMCAPNGLSTVLAAWVDSAKYSDFWGGTIRAAALTATLKVGGKEVKVPLAVMASQGAKGIKLCDTVLMTDIPRSQRVNVSFEFATSEESKIGDIGKVIAAIADLAVAATGLQSFGGHAVFGGTFNSEAVSFLKANKEPVDKVTAAVNALLAFMKRKNSPRPTEIGVNIATTRIVYVANKKDVFAIYKEWRPSRMRVDPLGGYGINQASAYSAAFPQKSMYGTFATTASRFPGWSSKPTDFCQALLDTFATETDGDRVASYVALAEHANYQQVAYQTEFPAVFKQARKTCLWPHQSRVLVKLGYPDPFPSAFPRTANDQQSNVVAAIPSFRTMWIRSLASFR